MAPTDMPSSERAKEVFVGLGPEVGAMFHANAHTDYFGVIFLEVQSTYRNECCSLRNLSTSSSHRALASSLRKHKHI